MQKVQIKGRRILAKEVTKKEDTVLENGVYVPRTNDSKDSQSVEIVSIGEGVIKDFEIGQVYILPRYGNDSYVIDGVTYYLVNEDDLSIQII